MRVDDPAGEAREGRLHVVDDDLWHLIRSDARHERGDGPVGERRRDEGMTVSMLADAGDIQRARLGRPGIGDDVTGDQDRVGVIGPDDHSTGQRSDLGQGHGDHAEASPSCVAAASSALRASARSSKGWTSPPISWPVS